MPFEALFLLTKENAMKKTFKKIQLNKETIRDLQAVVGGCDYCVSRGFTNCTYCNTNTKWEGDCTQI